MYAILNRWVLSSDLKVVRQCVVRRASGSAFQSLGAEQLKVLSPMVVRRAGGTDREGKLKKSGVYEGVGMYEEDWIDMEEQSYEAL